MITLRFEPVLDLGNLADIPNRFETYSVFDVRHESGGIELVPRAMLTPLRKNYDALEPPAGWPQRFDTANWLLVTASDDEVPVASAIGARATPGLAMLEGRHDLAVLWDIRVHPGWQRSGVGSAPVAAVQAWAAFHGCTELKVETQNTNPAACRFYLALGCTLAQAREGAYPKLPHEVQLIWRKPLLPARGVQVEPALPADADRIKNFVEGVIEASVTREEPLRTETVDNVNRNVDWWLQHPGDGVQLKAVLDGHLVGIVQVKEFWNLCSLFVHPQFQGGGVGRLLLEAARAQCAGRSPKQALWLNAAPRAVPFYAHLGFRRRAPSRPLPPGFEAMMIDL